MSLGDEEAIDGRAGEECECGRVGGRPAGGYESGGRSRGEGGDRGEQEQERHLFDGSGKTAGGMIDQLEY